MSDKVDHVCGELAKPTPSGHGCHWPGCTVDVPPAVWGCRKHWYSLPRGLRDRIWAAYRPGQERDKRPSADYLEVARDVQNWIAANERR